MRDPDRTSLTPYITQPWSCEPASLQSFYPIDSKQCLVFFRDKSCEWSLFRNAPTTGWTSRASSGSTEKKWPSMLLITQRRPVGGARYYNRAHHASMCASDLARYVLAKMHSLVVKETVDAIDDILFSLSFLIEDVQRWFVWQEMRPQCKDDTYDKQCGHKCKDDT